MLKENQKWTTYETASSGSDTFFFQSHAVGCLMRDKTLSGGPCDKAEVDCRFVTFVPHDSYYIRY